MKTRIRLILALLTVLAPVPCFADDPVVGIVEWQQALEPDATQWDKTDYWTAIALSPATGKYASSTNWTARVNAERQAREKCNARDAQVVVVCCNGWAALALGSGPRGGKNFGWGVGWGEDQATAERYALEAALQQRLRGARVVYSINSREMKLGGAIAFSKSTGQWGYAPGGGKSAPYQALQYCNAPDAEVIAQQSDCWMALAVGDGNIYGWGYAGNRDDAVANAVKECSKRTRNAEAVLVFPTNGVAR